MHIPHKFISNTVRTAPIRHSPKVALHGSRPAQRLLSEAGTVFRRRRKKEAPFVTDGARLDFSFA